MVLPTGMEKGRLCGGRRSAKSSGSANVRSRSRLSVLDLQHAAANAQVALRKRHFDPRFAEFLFDSEIEVAAKTTRPVTFLAALYHQLKFQGVFSELLQENAGSRILQCVRIFTPDC